MNSLAKAFWGAINRSVVCESSLRQVFSCHSNSVAKFVINLISCVKKNKYF